ncbi:transketolase family protein [Methanogenium organophilum]|uniref:Transketolase family protein n=1 Tax=Methanogenium organophilum TaxID=2199 RepID=A0A9X9S3G0_METOG|nr:transketolase C-terminal domain-containing protein [Methanogenium organophilum]WAI01204.1 transketolase family protein [Methanogenium organophilum]
MTNSNLLNIRFISKLGQRGAFAISMEEIAAQDDEIVVLTADLTTLTGLTRFKEKFPEKLINTGIAEQNMVGVAAGMAKEGKNVFVTTYSNFLAMRSYEQIRVQLGYMKSNVKVIGTGSGLAMGMSGNTHYGIEDLTLMRAIPNVMVVSPADGLETVKVIKSAARYQGPMYVRLSGGMKNPIVYNEDYEYEFGKAIQLKNGRDIAIIATGTMVYESLKAAEILHEKGVSASVINMHTIKPLDTAIINDVCLHSNLIVTVEEHSVIGGLGGAVAECLSEIANTPRQVKIGIHDAFQRVGDYQYLLEENNLTGPQIADRIISEYSNDGKNMHEIDGPDTV